MTAIDDFWQRFKQHEPGVRLGGILARKPGYHNSRDHLPTSDYSVWQFPSLDQYGPKDEASAIDLTFPDAQRGDYRTIAKYSKRLMAAGKANDPRTAFFREFFGNTDSDREVEGYDFTKDRPATSDSSHLWHIHVSWHRRYINDPAAADALFSILSGETLADYLERHGTVPAKTKPPAKQDAIEVKAPRFPTRTHYNACSNKHEYGGIRMAQAQLKARGWRITVDGYGGPQTCRVVKAFQREKGLTVDGLIGPKTWHAIFTAPL